MKCTAEEKEGLEANCTEVCGSVRPFRIDETKQFDCQIKGFTFEVEMNKENGAIKILYTIPPTGESPDLYVC